MPANAAAPELKAPEGTRTGTVWIWLIAVAIPLASLLTAIPYVLNYATFFDTFLTTLPTSSSTEQLDPAAQQAIAQFIGANIALVSLVWAVGLVLIGLQVLFAWLDWRELKRRGVPNPFHWAWSFFGLAGAGNLVTMIGRSVVVKRRTGQGLAPLWATIIVQAVMILGSTIGAIAWVSLIVTSAVAQRG